MAVAGFTYGRANTAKLPRSPVASAPQRPEANGTAEARSALRILIVEDDPLMRGACADIAESLGHHVTLAATVPEARKAIAAGTPDLLLLDLRLPGESGTQLLEEVRSTAPEVQVVMMSAQPSVSTAVSSLRQGAVDYLQKPFDFTALASVLERATETHCRRAQHLQLERRLLAGEIAGPVQGRSSAMQRLARLISRVALSSQPVLIYGEQGAGKEDVARIIHSQGARASQPFLALPCEALAPETLASELLRALFPAPGSRALDVPGGTLFLDEIAELAPELQLQLLRFLEGRSRQTTLGPTSTEVPDAAPRLLAATAQDLAALVQAGRFRKDLFYRLNVVSVRVPSLRDRRDDLPLLVAQILARLSQQDGREYSLTESSWDLILGHDWPGNMRELDLTLQHACAFASGPEINLHQLPTPRRTSTSFAASSAPEEAYPEPDRPFRELLAAPKMPSGAVTLRELERQAILQTLRLAKGDKIRAAGLLGIGKTTLYRKLKEYDLAQAQE